MRHPFVACLLVLGAVAVARPSHACWPQGYSFGDFSVPTGKVAVADGEAVVICPTGDGERGNLLREDIDSGEVVEVMLVHVQADDNRRYCYVDECVPVGQYRYGYEIPYTCIEGGCGGYYFGEVAVTRKLGEECQRTQGTVAPVAYSGQLPWQDEGLACTGGDDAAVAESGCAVAGTSGAGGLWTTVVVGLAVFVAGARRRRLRRGR